ncbi:MAG: metallophosphoesterase [Planctomycetota bacterium]
MNDVLFTQPRQLPRRRFYRLKRAFWSLASTVSLGGLYAGHLCPTWVRVDRLEMPLNDLAEPFVGRKLVHISDLHCSPMVVPRYLRQVLDRVAAEEPDVLVITGDLVTGGTAYARRVAGMLASVPAKVARVACLGNHDYGIYHPSGRGHMRQLSGYLTGQLHQAGVQVLRNQSLTVHLDGHALQVVGVEDAWSGRYDPETAFADARAGMPTIGLTHNPDGAADLVERGAHWVLAGHTHGNKAGDSALRDAVLPVESEVYAGGYYSLDGAHLYVNRGLSYARRLNLNKRPEITVFTLQRAS